VNIPGRRYRVVHRTTYEYSAEMLDGYSVANLLARQTPTQRVVSTELTTTPAVDERDDRSDVFGNHVVQLGVHHPHTRLVVEATTEVVVQPQIEPRVNPTWEQAAAQTAAARGVLALDVLPFLAGSRFVPTYVEKHTDNQGVVRAELLHTFASEFSPGRPILEVIRGVCGSIFNGYRFDQSSTTVSTPLSEVMDKRAGVCQDFAHLAVGAFRARGIAARYVSGYIETDPPPGEVKTIGADASHAWCAVWIPEHGWVDFDPTNNIIGPDRHVTVGWGRDYADVAPIRGVVIGPTSQQKLSVAVDVVRLD
jgi:transglutaminase-like putative cysteine protease